MKTRESELIAPRSVCLCVARLLCVSSVCLRSSRVPKWSPSYS